MSEPFDPSTFVTISPDVADLNGAALLKLAAALQILEQWCVARACARTAGEFLKLYKLPSEQLVARNGLEAFIEARCTALPLSWQASVQGEEVIGTFEAVAVGDVP